MNCKQCNKPLTGRRRLYCSSGCANAYTSYLKYKSKKNKTVGDPLSEKLTQEYGRVRVYAV